MINTSRNKSDVFKSSLLKYRGILIAFILAFPILLICSKSSPLYPINDWVDANAYFTIGRSMLDGLVPYRDLFDHKGPLIYFIHAISALFSRSSFIGVWFFELIAATAFLYIQYKILKLLNESKFANIAFLMIIAAIVYSSLPFRHGDSIEEFSLPLISYALYLGIKALKLRNLPTKTEFLILGITSACVLWMKYSILGFYIGWFIFFFIYSIATKRFPEIIKGLLYIILGILITTLPIMIYFVLNNALGDLYKAYFYDNLFLYSVSSDLLSKIYTLYHIGINVSRINKILFAISFVGIISLLFKKKFSYILFILATCSMGFFVIYIGGKSLLYYSLIFYVFIFMISPILSPIISKLRFLNVNIKKVALVCTFILSVSFAFSVSENTYLLKYSKQDLPQYKFAKIINQTEDATLLNYRFLDGGFYLTSGLVPSCKYYYIPNMPLEEAIKTQDSYVKNNLVDYLVTRDYKLSIDNYECIANESLYLEGRERMYYLYKTKK